MIPSAPTLIRCLIVALVTISAGVSFPAEVEPELQRLETLLEQDPARVLDELPAVIEQARHARPLLLRCLRLQVEAGMTAGLTDELVGWCDEGLRLLEDGDDPPARIVFLLGQSAVYEHQGHYLEAHEAVDQAEAAAATLGNPSFRARVKRARGEIHVRAGNHTAALESLLAAFELYERLGDRKEMSMVYSAIAVTYGNLGDFAQELEYHQKSLNYIDPSSTMDASIAHYNIALALRSLERYDEAVASFTRALTMSRELEDEIGAAYAEARLASIAAVRGKTERALGLFERAIEVFAEHGYAQMEFVCLTDRARLRTAIGQSSAAFRDLERAEELASRLDKPKRWAELAERKALAHAGAGNFRQAFEAMQEREKHLTVVHQGERETQLNELEVRFKTRQKEADYRLLTQEIELDRIRHAEAGLRANLILTLLALVVVALAATLLLVRRRHHRQEADLMRERARELKAVVAERTADLERYATALESRSDALRDANDRITAADQHKSTFLASMSHELRTPLNSIIGFADVLLKVVGDNPNPKFLRFRDNILNGGRHLLSLINNVLDLSKIEAGRMELNLESTDVEEVVAGVLAVMTGYTHGRGVTISQQIDSDLPELTTDGARLKQVLFNLLSNAVKYSPDGGTVELVGHKTSSTGSADDGATIRLEVIDHGEGIAAADLEFIFEPFRQVGLPKRRAGGTGLGLALVKEMCELLGGRIDLFSTVGVGTRAVVTLPIEHHSPDAQASGAFAAVQASETTVLVVEQQPESFAILASALERPGVLTVRARDGHEARHMAAQLRPGMLAIDLGTARGGWASVVTLAADPVARQRPWLLLSHNDDSLAVAAELDAVLLAPVEPETLMWRIEGLLGSPLAVPRSKVLLIGQRERATDQVDSLKAAVAHLWTTINHERAWDIICESHVDVVLLDLVHSAAEGLEFERSLRREEGQDHLPVLAWIPRTLSPQLRQILTDGASGGSEGVTAAARRLLERAPFPTTTGPLRSSLLP